MPKEKEKTAKMPKDKTAIEGAGEIVVDFLKRVLKVKDVKVIKASKVEEGWDIEAEVYEESSFIKSVGLPTKMQDRNIYVVELNNDMEVESYSLKGIEKEETK